MNRAEPLKNASLPSTLVSDRLLTGIVMGFLLAVLIFFLLYPVYDICKLSFYQEGVLTLKNYASYFSNPRMFRSLTNSVYVSVVTMIITTVLAFFFAYGLTRTTIPGKGLFYTISTFPLIAPSIIQGLALILLFGRNGLVTRYVLHTDWNIYGATGIIAAECLYCFPNALFILYTTLSAVDTRLDEAAQSLGASALKTFYKVTLPSAKYGIASAAALSFNLTITDFGVPVVIGGNYSVLATEIYQQVIGMQRFDLGATISVILLIPSVAAFLLNYYLTKKSYALISGQARPFLQPSRPLKKWAFSIYCWIPCIFILIVFITVFLGSFVKTWPYDFSLTLRHFNFPSLGGHAPLWTHFWTSILKGEWQSIIAYKYAPIWNSLLVSILVAIGGASLTLLAGYIIEKKKPKGDQILYTLSVLPAAIPGTVMGLGYILAFNKPYFFIYGTFWIIIINIIICNFTLGVLSSIANLKQIDKSIEEAAVSLGANPITTFTRVVFPLTRTAFFSNMAFFFMRAMTTISAVIFLISAKVKLAAIEIIFLDIDGRTASANAMCTIIILLVVGMLVAMRLITGRGGLKGMGAS
ncbi:MAG TPA: ABC transporter permease subunit [Thermodesulfobacteriota bacterium]|nr:ABC transporter permease subunit [Thermodesulfobacteriota bacterium]